jgi:medium-chain acyl-[acyl-carrier-protein] hydrolase
MKIEETTPLSPQNWWVTPERRPHAEVRLFAFPYAGGSAGSFRPWAKQFGPRIELSVLQLPGREDRFDEPMLTDMARVVAHASPWIARNTDKPFVLFGHSVGALMAYEVARHLISAGVASPLHVIVGGKRAPHVPIDRKPMHELSDPELIDRLHHFGGTPKAVLETPELLELFLPRLRADFQINETYRCVEGAGLPVPITVMGGVDDPETTPQTLQAWKQHAQADFQLRMYPGGHFFVHQVEHKVLADMQRIVLDALGSRLAAEA